MDCRRSIRAFTLLELLVAMSIMAVITTALYSTLHFAFRAKDTLEEAVSPYAQINAVYDIMRTDLACVVNPDLELAGDFVGEEAEISQNSSMKFYTSNYKAVEDEIACDIYQVEYSLEKYDQWLGYALVRNSSTNVLSPTDVETKTEVLCRGIYSFDIEYYDGASWTTNWDSADRDYTILPPLVKVTIELVNKDKNIRQDSDETIRVIREFLVPQVPE